MSSIKTITTVFLLILSCVAVQSASASVVMTGTRVIYPAQAQDKVIQLSNQDDYPYLVQMWVDSGDSEETPQTSTAPFVVSPQIFRVNQGAGQVVRLVFTGENLAKDRESLFYLNFVQVPAIRAKDLQANKLLLSINSRIKLFYRPDGLVGEPNNLNKTLDFKLQGNGVLVSNNSGYFATVRSAELVHAGKTQVLVRAVVVSPLSQVNWPLPVGMKASAGDRLRLTLVNDFGVDTTAEQTIH